MTEVRYVEGGNNRVLRHVLRLVWEQQCYWCRNFKDYLDLEIDHILPRTAGAAERERLRKDLGLPADYDVQLPYNLAPICGACNGEKSDADLTEKPSVLTALRKAARRAPEVARRVQSFGKTSKLAGALLEAVEADLDDAKSREAFEEGAPAIVQRLAELGEGKADYASFRYEDVEVDDESHRVVVRLNEAGRAAMTILESVAGGRLQDTLRAPIADLFRQVETATAGALEDHDEGLGAPSVETVAIDWPEITVSAVRFEGAPPAQLEFDFEGRFEATLTGSVARSTADGGELEYVQGDASVTTGFKFGLSWEPGDPAGALYFDQIWLEGFHADTWVDGHRPIVWDAFFEQLEREDELAEESTPPMEAP